MALTCPVQPALVLDDPLLQSEAQQARLVSDTKFLHGVVFVPPNREGANIQIRRDLVLVLPHGDRAQHFELPLG